MYNTVTYEVNDDTGMMEATCQECNFTVVVKDVFKTYYCRYCSEGYKVLWTVGEEEDD